jgi:hypothetical protein
MGLALIWQVVAIWLVVAASSVCFFWDERRTKAAKLDQQARYFAQAPQYRYTPRVPVEIVTPEPRSGGLLRSDQAFFAGFIRERAQR